MFDLAFSLGFGVVILLAMLFGALKAKKKVWQFSVVRMVQTVVSAILGALAASAIAWYGIGAVIDMFGGDLGGIMEEVPSAKEAIAAIISMMVAPMLFLPLYAIIRGITRIFTKMLTRLLVKLTTKKKKVEEKKEEPAAVKAPGSSYYEKLYGSAPQPSKKELKKKEFALEKSNWISALCGAACGLLTICVWLIPMVGTLGVVNDVASLPLHTAAEADESGTVEMVADILDAASNNAGTVTVKLVGGGLVYDMMTSYKVGGETATLKNETGTIKAIANAVVVSADEDTTKEESAKSVRAISKAFSKSTLLPTLVSEITASASEDWKNGKDFHGIEMPSIGEDLDHVMLSVVDGLAASDTTTIKQDVETIVDIVAVLIEKDALDDFGKDPMSLFENEQVTEKIFLDLLNNPRLCVLIDGFTDFGVSMLMQTVSIPEKLEPIYDEFKGELKSANAETEEELAVLYAEIFDNYGLRVSEELTLSAAQNTIEGGDILAWVEANVVADRAAFVEKTEIVPLKMITDGRHPVTDNKKEAKAIAHAFSVIYVVLGDLDDGGNVQGMLRSLGPVLDSFATTETIGKEETALILKALLQSEMVHDKIGLSVIEASNSAESISKNSEVKGYAEMMVSLSKIVDVIEAANDKGKDTEAAVKEMLADLTPEAADVIKNMATPNVVKNYGVSEKSSKPVSGMISDTFGNLADAKENGMSDEEYDKESAAVADMMNVLMSTGSQGKTFGEDSRTGTTATEFVDNIMNSTVMSQTVVETVYGEGDEPTQDPLLSESTMDDEERNELVSALNNKYAQSDKSAETEKEIISIAAMMNVQVGIVDGEVVAANEPAVLPAE